MRISNLVLIVLSLFALASPASAQFYRARAFAQFGAGGCQSAAPNLFGAPVAPCQNAALSFSQQSYMAPLPVASCPTAGVGFGMGYGMQQQFAAPFGVNYGVNQFGAPLGMGYGYGQGVGVNRFSLGYGAGLFGANRFGGGFGAGRFGLFRGAGLGFGVRARVGLGFGFGFRGGFAFRRR